MVDQSLRQANGYFVAMPGVVFNALAMPEQKQTGRPRRKAGNHPGELLRQITGVVLEKFSGGKPQFAQFWLENRNSRT